MVSSLLLALVAGAADLLGGLLTVTRRQVSRESLLYVTGLAAGFIVAVALLDRVPEAMTPDNPHGGLYILLGFLGLYLIENTFSTHAHNHEVLAPLEAIPTAESDSGSAVERGEYGSAPAGKIAHGTPHHHHEPGDHHHHHPEVSEPVSFQGTSATHVATHVLERPPVSPLIDLAPDLGSGVGDSQPGARSSSGCGHDHTADPKHGHTLVSEIGAEDCTISVAASQAALLGLLLHTLFDGVAIAAGFTASSHTGLVMFLAVMFHKLPEGFSASALMLAAGRGRRFAVLASAMLGLSTCLGALLASTVLGAQPVGNQQGFAQVLLSLATGTFLYIGCSDMIPATNQGANKRVVLMVFLGVLAYGASSSALEWAGLHGRI